MRTGTNSLVTKRNGTDKGRIDNGHAIQGEAGSIRLLGEDTQEIHCRVETEAREREG